VYESYPDRVPQAEHIQVTIEPRPPHSADDEEEEQQVIGAEDYELEETESEISDSETDQVYKMHNYSRFRL